MEKTLARKMNKMFEAASLLAKETVRAFKESTFVVGLIVMIAVIAMPVVEGHFWDISFETDVMLNVWLLTAIVIGYKNLKSSK